MQLFGPKQPYEEYYLKFDFSEDLVTDDSVASITATTVLNADDDTDVSSTMLDGNKDYVSDANAYVWIKAGTDGESYVVTCQITTSVLGEKYELEGRITVKET